MNGLTKPTSQAISDRLADDPNWASSPIGILAKLLVSTDAVSMSTVAQYYKRSSTVVTRWFTEIDIPGGTVEDRKLITKQTLDLTAAIQDSIDDKSLPAPSRNVLNILKDHS